MLNPFSITNLFFCEPLKNKKNKKTKKMSELDALILLHAKSSLGCDPNFCDEVLRKCLATPEEWAGFLASQLDFGVVDMQIEFVRHALSVLKACIRAYEGGPGSFAWDDPLETLLLCVKFDRAFTLRVKTSRKSPKVRGLPWILKERCTTEVPTISSKYVEFAKRFGASDEFMQRLNELLETAYP
jgi:hypothetical protein